MDEPFIFLWFLLIMIIDVDMIGMDYVHVKLSF
jgi:hypothetical protein